jgi:hypothetical protein
MDSHFLDLPDLQTYVKVPIITLTKFVYKKYPEKIIPFIIRDNLLMDIVDLGENIPGNPNINTVQLQR